MKIKCTPDDFRVFEKTTVKPQSGTFALYLLRKTSLGTIEAIDEIERRWRLHRQDVSYGGLKDKHAVTEQFVTVAGGPHRDITLSSGELRYLGQVNEPFTPKDISGNRFEIVVRDLGESEVAVMGQRIENVRRDGFPNYFDDQRFGSLGQSGEFIAQAWCQGNYERAIWLAIADVSEHDRSDSKDRKLLLQERWGSWSECLPLLRDSNQRDVVEYLSRRPTDFRTAISRIRPEIRGLYLSSFQSHVWNEILSQYLHSQLNGDQITSVRLAFGDACFYDTLSDEQRSRLAAITIPLPSARSRHDMREFLSIAERVLASRQMELREMRVKYPRDSFFSKGERRAIAIPADVTCEFADDERYESKKKANLVFELPRGCYATMLIKSAQIAQTSISSIPHLTHD